MNKKNIPLISVIIPIYKVENYIVDCLNSVILQTYGNIDIILVDDASPDNSVEIAEDILKKNGRDYVLIRQENKGLGEARNSGLNVARGEWIYFLDSDDMIVSDTLERLLLATKSDTDFVFSDYRVITSADEAVKEVEKSEPVHYDAETVRKLFLLRKKIILVPATLYRKSFLEQNQLRFAVIRWSEDQHFMFRALNAANKITYLKEPLYQYLKREGSIMNFTERQKILEGYYAIQKLGESFDRKSLFGRFMTARWVMGTLNSVARMYDYHGWNKLYKDLNGTYCLKILLKFPNIKVRLFSLVGIISPKLYYKVIKR